MLLTPVGKEEGQIAVQLGSEGGQPPDLHVWTDQGGSSGGGSAYLDYVKQQVDREDARKQSVEQRATTVITTSATVVTLLVAGASLSIKDKAFSIPHDAKWALVVAGFLFVAAAVAAIVASYPLIYQEPLPDQMVPIIKDHWDAPESEVQQNAAATLIQVWAAARKSNGVKSQAFRWAVVAQGLAVLATAVGAALIFF
jgi:hypothetical protein